MAQIKVFCETNALISGFYDGFPTDESLYASYPAITSLRKKIGAMPAVNLGLFQWTLGVSARFAL